MSSKESSFEHPSRTLFNTISFGKNHLKKHANQSFSVIDARKENPRIRPHAHTTSDSFSKTSKNKNSANEKQNKPKWEPLNGHIHDLKSPPIFREKLAEFDQKLNPLATSTKNTKSNHEPSKISAPRANTMPSTPNNKKNTENTGQRGNHTNHHPYTNMINTSPNERNSTTSPETNIKEQENTDENGKPIKVRMSSKGYLNIPINMDPTDGIHNNNSMTSPNSLNRKRSTSAPNMNDLEKFKFQYKDHVNEDHADNNQAADGDIAVKRNSFDSILEGTPAYNKEKIVQSIDNIIKKRRLTGKLTNTENNTQKSEKINDIKIPGGEVSLPIENTKQNNDTDDDDKHETASMEKDNVKRDSNLPETPSKNNSKQGLHKAKVEDILPSTPDSLEKPIPVPFPTTENDRTSSCLVTTASQLLLKNKSDTKSATNISNDNDNKSTVSEERKPRSTSKSFLTRKSFSPSSLSKVIPVPSSTYPLNNTRARLGSGNTNIQNKQISFPKTVRTSANRDDSISKIKLKNVSYASNQKNKEFHSYFKTASNDEKLIQSDNCALSKDILLQGKLYITDKNIRFYSNILGYVTTVQISYQEIVQIEKRSTMGIFPNALYIDTVQNKYNFASFSNRDSVYDLLTDIWTQFSVGARVRASALSISSEELPGSDYDSEDEDSIYSKDNYNTDTDITSTEDSLFKKTILNKATMGPLTHVPTSATYKPQDNEKKIYEGIIDGPLGSAVNILFGDDTDQLREILKKEKNYDISTIPPILQNKTRSYSYTKPLAGSVGPSKTKCLIDEKIDTYDLENFVQVTQMIKNPDVPSGNSFKVKVTFLLSWDANNKTNLLVYLGIVWTGKSWIKSAIERGTFEAVKDTMVNMVSEMNKMLAKKPLKKRTTRESENSIAESTLPTLEPKAHEPTQPVIESEKGSTTVLEDNLPAPLGTVYQLMFGDDTSYLKKITEKQDNFNLSEIPKFTKKSREYNYIKRLNNSMGPKQTKCFITENIEHLDTKSYTLVKQVSKTPDVPSGNSFTVSSRIYLSWGQNNTTNISILTNIVWSGRSFLKGAIEKGSIDGQKGSSKVLVEELKRIISSAGKRKIKRKSGRKTVTTETEKEEAIEPVIEPTTTVQNKSALFTIINTLKSLIGDFDFKSPKFIGSVLTILFFIFFINSRRSQPTASISFTQPGIFTINGDEFAYAPSFKNLYSSYENSRRKTSNKYNQRSLVEKNEEVTLWDWINDRGDKNLHDIDYFIHPDGGANHGKKANRSAKIDYYNFQQLEETIKIAKVQLEEMEKKLKDVQERERAKS